MFRDRRPVLVSMLMSAPGGGRKRETKMRIIQRTELYTDRGQYVVMTRTTVLDNAKLARIAGHLGRDAEDLVFSANAPIIWEEPHHD